MSYAKHCISKFRLYHYMSMLVRFMQLRKEIRDRQRKMQQAAKELDFMAAAKYRDEIKDLQGLLETAR